VTGSGGRRGAHRIHPELLAQVVKLFRIHDLRPYHRAAVSIRFNPVDPAVSDPEVHLAGIRGYVEAGFDEVYIGQVGGEHDGFFEFYANTVLPRLREG